MYKMQGKDIEICKKCQRPSCIFPTICKNLNNSHKQLTNLYKKALQIKGIKRILIGSGVRYDLLYAGQNMSNDGREYAANLIKNHVSGRLKVAPEHTEDNVLNCMRKPPYTLYQSFAKYFGEENRKNGQNQQIIPYFISSHPECTLKDMLELHQKTSKENTLTEQIQDFTPTPMTLSTAMFYTGINPYTGKKVYVARDMEEKRIQKSFFFIKERTKRIEIENFLSKNNRSDILKQIRGFQNPKRPYKK